MFKPETDMNIFANSAYTAEFLALIIYTEKQLPEVFCKKRCS